MLGMALVVAALIIIGSICGIYAAFRLRFVNDRLRQAEYEIGALRQQVARTRAVEPAAPVVPEQPVAAAPPPPAPEFVEPLLPIPPVPPVPRYAPAAYTEPRPATPPPLEPASGFSLESVLKGASLEEFLGLRTIAFVGAAMLLVGLALGLKYVYDNWVDETGRLAIGVALSIIALGCGELFRRKQWQVLFQALTGVGLAGFYLNIYFSFQVYHMSTAALAMGLAVGVTLLAVVMAVAHDSMAIAVLGMAGGFLSPVLLSTGENHPYALFTYILILDLIALGAAYFRQWRLLDKLAFVGTTALYAAWYVKFYDIETQMAPALLYASIFYVLFLILPMLNAMVRKKDAPVESLVLIAANALTSFSVYYNVLFDAHRQVLGFVIIGQALLVFLLFRAWEFRMREARVTGQALLIVSLALALIAVPIVLRLYSVAVVWAVQGALLCWMGSRHENIFVRVAGLGALVLAVGALYTRLPLHVQLFTPVVNLPFGSWLFVVAALAVAAYFYRPSKWFQDEERYVPHFLYVISLSLFCLLLSLETASFWQVRMWTSAAPVAAVLRIHQFSSLIVLWAIIVTALTAAAQHKNLRLLPLAWAAAAVGALIFLVAFHRPYPAMLVFNGLFLPRLTFLAALGYLSWITKRPYAQIALGIELTAWAGLAYLGTQEILRWAQVSAHVNYRFGVSAVSAYWAILACGLVWYGLATRCQERRVAGFVLFAFTILKVVFMDTAQLERIYQVLSWLACGLLLMVAAVIYQRYSALLLEKPNKDAQ